MTPELHSSIVIGAKAPVLRKSAESVREINKDIKELISEMRRTMKEAEGIGLAAPQVGKPLRLFVAEVNKKFYVLINPEIIKASKDLAVMEEGCLSIPGFFGEVRRPAKITIVGLNQSGKKIKIKAWGLLARVFQHEMDHLDGKLFVDKTKELRKYENE